jgi:regulator of sirC expression with transglutaminase-like and TPR domain
MLDLLSRNQADDAAALGASYVAEVRLGVAEAVRRILAVPDEALDYARAKVALDRIIDPTIDADAVRAELDRLTECARRLAGASPSEGAKLAALRTLIYESGPWNEHRPFVYDHSNFQNIRLKLMSHYLETRLGNCISMPILFLMLADRLGLNVALSMAPNHMLLRFTNEGGRTINLEATSGANPARDAWYREIMPMSDRSVGSGLYLRTLSRRESVAFMVTTVMEDLKIKRRHREVAAVCEIILGHNARCGMTLANLGAAYGRIIMAEFLERYRSTFLIPLPLRAQYLLLLQRSDAAFAAAEALGWEPAALDKPKQ